MRCDTYLGHLFFSRTSLLSELSPITYISFLYTSGICRTLWVPLGLVFQTINCSLLLNSDKHRKSILFLFAYLSDYFLLTYPMLRWACVNTMGKRKELWASLAFPTWHLYKGWWDPQAHSWLFSYLTGRESIMEKNQTNIEEPSSFPSVLIRFLYQGGASSHENLIKQDVLFLVSWKWFCLKGRPPECCQRCLSAK